MDKSLRGVGIHSYMFFLSIYKMNCLFPPVCLVFNANSQVKNSGILIIIGQKINSCFSLAREKKKSAFCCMLIYISENIKKYISKLILVIAYMMMFVKEEKDYNRFNALNKK